jgi:hypothetical protein
MTATKLAPAAAQTSDLPQLLDRYLRDPTIDVAKLDQMVALQERMMRWQAETAWNAAMAEAQSKMHAVAYDSNNPQTRSRYTSYATMDAALRPIYSPLGFALSFNTDDSRENFVKIICDVSRGGHTRRYQIEMPADGKGARGNDVMTKTHATGSAVSYGMRYLLKMIFNVSTGDVDDDGNAASRRSRTPAPPAPNVMHQVPHDAETGETREPAPEEEGEETAAERIHRLDGMLIDAAEAGMTALQDTWKMLDPADRKQLKAALDRRHKPRAVAVDEAARGSR